MLAAITLVTALAAFTTLETALHLLAERKLAEAERSFREVLARSPNDAYAHLMLARTLIELDRQAEAIGEIDKALAISKSPEVQFEAGRILRAFAERHFAELQQIAPESSATLELDGERLEWKGDLDGALQRYISAAKLEPERPGVHYRLGNIYWRKRELRLAARELQKELATTPHHGMANLRMGQVLLNSGDAARAMSFFEKASKAMPQSAEARRELGKAFKQLGRLEQARQEWEIVARISPADDRVHYLLGGLYRELGEMDLSKSAFKRHREILDRRLQQSIER